MNQPSATSTAATLVTESPLHDLDAIIRSRTPLIAVETNEEPQIVSLVRQIGAKRQARVLRWTVTRDGVREERQASLGVHEFDRIWERIDGSGWRNMNDCTGSGGTSDPVYDIEVKDWSHQRAFECVNAGPLPFPYNTIVDELDLRAAAIGGPEAQGDD